MAPLRDIGSIVVGALVLAGCSGVADVQLEAAPSVAPTPTAALDGALPPPLAEVPETRSEAAAAEPTGVVGRDGVDDSLYPRLGNSGYDVTHYDLDIRFTPDDLDGPGSIVARATIAAETTDDLVSFNLDLSGLDVSAVSVDGRAASFDRSGSELTIVPAEPLPSATEFVTVVDYSGAPAPVAVDETSLVNGWTPSDGGIFVAGEPTGASGWFPVNDHPSDRASYTITVTAPDDLAVAANGILVSRGDTDEHGTTTWRYEAAAPMASYLVTLAIDDLTLVEQGTFDGVLLRHAFASELAEAARADTERLPEVLEYYTSVFGPFPFDVYGHLVVDTPFGAALETQTLTVFGSDTIAGTGLLTNIVAHELAHQWFGDSVGLADWGDLWLNEGFATYAEFLWLEHDGRFTRDQIGPLIVGSGLSFAPPGRPDPADLFSPSIYFRGALTLHAIRLTVGDDAFFDILRGWTEAFGGATATTDDFIELAEAASGRTLRPIIEAWLYDDAMPVLPAAG